MMNDIELKLRIEQVKSVHSQTFFGIFGSGLASALLALILWDVIDNTHIVVWLSIILGMQIIRLIPYFSLNKQGLKTDDYVKWGHFYIVLFLLMGLTWGASAIVLFPQDKPIYHLIIAIWMLGLSASVSAYIAYYEVLIAFLLPMVSPIAIRSLLIADDFHLALGIGLCVYTAAMLPAWKNINHSWIDSILLNNKLEAAMAEIKTLKGIIPICANCKNIRDDKGFWNQLESFISKHLDAEFSHGICPDCAKELYPELEIGKK